MTIQDILTDLESRRRLYGIDEFRRFLNDIGNPQQRLKCVHIAGTNGKGSTANYIQHTFSQKYKVGLFSSPYLIVHNDRIRINDTFISDEKIIEYYYKYNDLWLKYNLSSFEIDTFMAIQYFIENNVDFCVFEVGLGGRLDATNVIYSFLSIITSISYDHMEFLGDTLDSIALEKAGIIKENSTFMTTDYTHALLYQSICDQQKTNCIILDELPVLHSQNPIIYQYQDYCIKLSTSALYQHSNSFLALKAIEFITNQFPLTAKEIENGLASAKWKGRLEKISDKPLILVDGAHNKAGIESLIKSLAHYDKVKVLYSSVQDKPYLEIIDLLKQAFNDINVTTFDFYRAVPKEELLKLKDVNYVESVKSFIEENRFFDGVIIICGSLYFISSILKGGY